MMLCEPTLRVDVLKFAWPFPRFPVPSTVLPSLKVTVPVGLAVDDVTVAVNLTVRPDFAGLSDDASVVAEVASFTTCVSVVDMLAACSVSPL